MNDTSPNEETMRCSGGGPSRLQSARLVAVVAELVRCIDRVNPKRIMFFAAVASIVLLLGCSAAQPLRRSPANIRASLLKRTPVGVQYKSVEVFVQKEGWQPHRNAGAPPADLLQRDAAGDLPPQPVRQTMNVYLGDYWAWPIFGRKVWGYWLFDTNNHLLDVWVTKYTQGL